MTISEKLHAFDAAHPAIHVYREGMFAKIYNESAFLFSKYVRRYKVNVSEGRHGRYYSIGFPFALLAEAMAVVPESAAACGAVVADGSVAEEAEGGAGGGASRVAGPSGAGTSTGSSGAGASADAAGGACGREDAVAAPGPSDGAEAVRSEAASPDGGRPFTEIDPDYRIYGGADLVFGEGEYVAWCRQADLDATAARARKAARAARVVAAAGIGVVAGFGGAPDAADGLSASESCAAGAPRSGADADAGHAVAGWMHGDGFGRAARAAEPSDDGPAVASSVSEGATLRSCIVAAKSAVVRCTDAERTSDALRAIVAEILRFRLESATPMECMLFLQSIQKRCYGALPESALV